MAGECKEGGTGRREEGVGTPLGTPEVGTRALGWETPPRLELGQVEQGVGVEREVRGGEQSQMEQLSGRLEGRAEGWGGDGGREKGEGHGDDDDDDDDDGDDDNDDDDDDGGDTDEEAGDDGDDGKGGDNIGEDESFDERLLSVLRGVAAELLAEEALQAQAHAQPTCK